MGKYKFDVAEMLREEQAKQERLAQSSDPRVAENAKRQGTDTPFPRRQKAPKPPKK